MIIKIAIEHDHVRVIRGLSEKETLPENLLYDAIVNNSEACFNFLIKQEDLDINHFHKDKDSTVNTTPLILAITKNKINFVKKLLEHKGVDINLPDEYGMTPLHYACYSGKLKVVNLLLEKNNILLNIKTTSKLYDVFVGSTPFMLASRKGHDEIKHAINTKAKSDFTEFASTTIMSCWKKRYSLENPILKYTVKDIIKTIAVKVAEKNMGNNGLPANDDYLNKLKKIKDLEKNGYSTYELTEEEKNEANNNTNICAASLQEEDDISQNWTLLGNN